MFVGKIKIMHNNIIRLLFVCLIGLLLLFFFNIKTVCLYCSLAKSPISKDAECSEGAIPRKNKQLHRKCKTIKVCTFVWTWSAHRFFPNARIFALIKLCNSPSGLSGQGSAGPFPPSFVAESNHCYIQQGCHHLRFICTCT